MIRVWNLYLRIFHWSLVVSFSLAYLTEFDAYSLHNIAGYVVCLLLLYRIIVGIFGHGHVRFTDFVKSPRTIFNYIGAIFQNNAKRYIGHNPAGGAMVVALLITLLLVCISGLILYGLEGNAGPLAFLYGHFPGYVDDWVEDIHNYLSNFAALLIAFHLGGVLWSSFAHKENLIKAMITGEKRS
jgi:cytochrome b